MLSFDTVILLNIAMACHGRAYQHDNRFGNKGFNVYYYNEHINDNYIYLYCIRVIEV